MKKFLSIILAGLLIFGAINVRFDAINIYINTKDKNFFD